MTYVIYKQGNKWYVESSNGVSIDKSGYSSLEEALNSIMYPETPQMFYVSIPPCDKYIVTPLPNSKEATYANNNQSQNALATPSLPKVPRGRPI